MNEQRAEISRESEIRLGPDGRPQKVTVLSAAAGDPELLRAARSLSRLDQVAAQARRLLEGGK